MKAYEDSGASSGRRKRCSGYDAGLAGEGVSHGEPPSRRLPPEAAWRNDLQARTSTAQPPDSVTDTLPPTPKAKATKSGKPSRAVTRPGP